MVEVYLDHSYFLRLHHGLRTHSNGNSIHNIMFIFSLAACLVWVVHAAVENAAIPPNESTAETESIGKNESAQGKSPLIDVSATI